MFDIGFSELVVIAILALLVLGPERLPGAIKTTSLWIARIRRSFQQIKTEIEREMDMSEIKQQIHNESVMQKLSQTKTDIDKNIQQARETLAKELGDDSYDLSDAFAKNSDQETSGKLTEADPDTLPDHEPLPDIYSGEPDETDEPDNTPAQRSHPTSDKP